MYVAPVMYMKSTVCVWGFFSCNLFVLLLENTIIGDDVAVLMIHQYSSKSCAHYIKQEKCDMVKCRYFRHRMHPNSQQAVIQFLGFVIEGPSDNYHCTVLLWNPLRPFYHNQKKASRHAYEGCYFCVTMPAPHTAWIWHFVTTACLAPWRKC